MNANFTRQPSPAEVTAAKAASEQAKKLVREFASEVSDAREWPNEGNVRNTRTALLAYIADLEQVAAEHARLVRRL